jgi:hypothetical protein
MDGYQIGLYRHGEPTDGLPAESYPYLEGDEPRRRLARASALPGIGAGEIPNSSISLANAAGQVSALFQYRLPLKRQCTLYGYDGTAEFAGQVAAVDLGPVASLEIDA